MEGERDIIYTYMGVPLLYYGGFINGMWTLYLFIVTTKKDGKEKSN
jgi:hypothetical protein